MVFAESPLVNNRLKNEPLKFCKSLIERMLGRFGVVWRKRILVEILGISRGDVGFQGKNEVDGVRL